MKELKNNIKIKIKMRRLKKALDPDKNFLKSSKSKFLSSLPAGSTRHYRHSGWRLSYAFAVVLFLVLGTGGLAALADIQNVSAANPLYELKRLSEDTRVVFTLPDEKSVIHSKLAERRFKEIEKEIENIEPTAESLENESSRSLTLSVDKSELASTPSSTVEKLNEDLVQHINIVINKIGESDNQKESRESVPSKTTAEKRICKIVKEAIEKNILEQGGLKKAQKHCENVDF